MKLNIILSVLIGILCFFGGWFGHSSYQRSSEVNNLNRAMVFLATDGAKDIFTKLEKHGVSADRVKFDNNGSCVQVRIKADDSNLLEIAEDIQSLVPDLEGTRVSFIVENQDGAGVIVYREQLFDTRPLFDEMMKKIEAEESVDSEQGVAPQSATRSESEAQVGDEPKPESEVRSQ